MADTTVETQATASAGVEKTTTGRKEKVSGGINKMQVSDIKSPKDLFIWFSNDPTGRWPILLFVAGFCGSLVLVVMTLIDKKAGYAPAGVAGLIVCAFGSHHFRTLMSLREVCVSASSIFIAKILFFSFLFVAV